MSHDSETAVAVEGDKEDRISDLPRNVIDSILEFLPAQDAARTSILSKKWRNVWSTLPFLVLDSHFRDELTEKSYSFFVETVYAILLMHCGDIIKFVLDVPEEPLPSYTEIDRWLLYVTRNGVKELSLSMSEKIPEGPLSMFNFLWYVGLLIDFGELSSISGALKLIRSVPNLSELDINVHGTNDDAEAVLKYLNPPTYLDRPLNKLKHVFVRWFWGSKVELLFMKLLLAGTPSLVSMTIELVIPGSREESIFMKDSRRTGSRDVRNTFIELINLPKASPKAELFIHQAKFYHS